MIAEREQQRISGDVDKKKRVSRSLIMSEPAMQEQIIYPRYKAVMPEERSTHTNNIGNNELDRNHRNNIIAHTHEDADMHMHVHLDASNHHDGDDSFDQLTGQYGRSALFTAEDWLYVNGGAPEAPHPYILSACPSSESTKLRETSGSAQSMSSSSHSQASTPLLTSVNRTWETAQC
jgi:hypothetical protein